MPFHLQCDLPTSHCTYYIAVCYFCLLNGCVPQPVYVLLNGDEKLVIFVTADNIKTLYDIMKHSHHQPPFVVSPFLSIHCWSRLLLVWCRMSFHRCLYSTDLEGGAAWDWGQLYYSISRWMIIWVSWSNYEVRVRTEPLFWIVSLPYHTTRECSCHSTLFRGLYPKDCSACLLGSQGMQEKSFLRSDATLKLQPEATSTCTYSTQ